MAHNVNTSKSSRKSGSNFVQAKGGASVRVSPGKGGVRVGPSHCVSTRQHFAKSYGGRKAY